MTHIKTLIIAATLACTFAPAINVYAMDLNNETHAQQADAQQENDNQAETQQSSPTRTPEQIKYANEYLWEAIRSFDAKEVLAALNAGADARSHDRDGEPPIGIAAECTQTEIVKMLLAHRADVNATNKEGETPLLRASGKTREGTIATIQILLTHNANVNQQDRYGRTPLAVCADWIARTSLGFKREQKILLTTAQLLIFADANPYLANKEGHDAPLSRGSKTMKQNILNALATKEEAFKQLDIMRTILQKQVSLNPDVPIEEIAKTITIPIYSSNQDTQEAYDYLNERIAQKWAEIKTELEITRLLNQEDCLPVSAVADIALDYLYEHRQRPTPESQNAAALIEKKE